MIALTFLCAACLVESPEAFCACCGVQLTAKDLTLTSNAPAAHLTASTAGAPTPKG